MCVDKPLDHSAHSSECRSVCRHVYRHVYRNVCWHMSVGICVHAYRHVCRYVLRHMCVGICVNIRRRLCGHVCGHVCGRASWPYCSVPIRSAGASLWQHLAPLSSFNLCDRSSNSSFAIFSLCSCSSSYFLACSTLLRSSFFLTIKHRTIRCISSAAQF